MLSVRSGMCVCKHNANGIYVYETRTSSIRIQSNQQKQNRRKKNKHKKYAISGRSNQNSTDFVVVYFASIDIVAPVVYIPCTQTLTYTENIYSSYI